MDPTAQINAVFNDALATAGSIALGLAGLAVTRMTLQIKSWFARRTVQDAVSTASGKILVLLAAGKLTLPDVMASHPALATAEAAALARVPDAADALGGVTAETMAALIVGAVGRALSADPTVPTLPALAPPNLSLAARLATPLKPV